MAKRKCRITDQNIRDCQEQGMKILQIAEKYGVQSYTVLRKIQKMEKEELQQQANRCEPKSTKTNLFGVPYDKVRSSPASVDFDIKIGDIISAVEGEITPERKGYRVTEIYDHIYIGKRLIGGNGKGTWKTAFRKSDYKKGFDPCLVKIVQKGGIDS